jgi:hypothetical protein
MKCSYIDITMKLFQKSVVICKRKYSRHCRSNIKINIHNIICFSMIDIDEILFTHLWLDRIGGVMVIVLALSAINCGFEPRSGQTKDYEIGICCFSAKHTALRRKSKDWLARNQNIVSEWSDVHTCRLLFQWASTIKIQLSVLV